jgi:hypothetical protein
MAIVAGLTCIERRSPSTRRTPKRARSAAVSDLGPGRHAGVSRSRDVRSASGAGVSISRSEVTLPAIDLVRSELLRSRDLDRLGSRLRDPKRIAERVAHAAVDAVEVLGRLLRELDALPE